MSGPRVLVIHAGGTIGMERVGGVYRPAPGRLAARLEAMAELREAPLPRFALLEEEPLLDSADMRPRDWQRIAELIAAHDDAFDGFVVLHGTDTMAYTASALSFMLENLAKPVILTGSQIPLAELRSDARENLITALLLAAEPRLAEVCLYFGGTLLRGNRSTKVSASGFGAFASPNFSPLGRVGVEIALAPALLRPPGRGALRVQPLAEVQVAALRLFPGITAELLQNVLLEPIQGLVLETYGAGNAPADEALLSVLRRACARGVVIVNCSQCLHGRVEMASYATGRALQEAGVVSGFDLTPEAALCKLLYLFSKGLGAAEVRDAMQRDLRGELSPA